jgi:UDP-N-acetylmuramoylalanine--D-glutamate ligase
MDASSYFKGKKVTLMRIGLLGRGVGDAAFLAKSGAEVLVVDAAPQEVMQPSVDALKEYSNIRFKFGPYDLNDFKDCDLVLKGAGTPADSPEIAEAHRNGIPVRMSADLFADISEIPMIGITGTRGKSTVTHMLEHIFREAGKKVLLGGNVRGVSSLALLEDVEEKGTQRRGGEAAASQVAVFELDSWQLQGFGEAHISPSLAVFTTFYPDHLNYYAGDLDAYLADKANIFLSQKFEDTLVLGAQCAELIQEKYGKLIRSHIVVVNVRDIPEDWELKIPGDHNRYNAAIALAAARAKNISDSVTRAALESFEGVPGRLHLVRTIDGVEIYNDTNSTTPDATIVALQALSGTKRVLLIMGGADKNLEMSGLISEIHKSAKRVTLLSGTGTNRIAPLLPNAQVFDNLAMAFKDAQTHADPGDVILFSPAFASFGMFTNEYDRGDQFVSLVQGIQA